MKINAKINIIIIRIIKLKKIIKKEPSSKPAITERAAVPCLSGSAEIFQLIS